MSTASKYLMQIIPTLSDKDLKKTSKSFEKALDDGSKNGLKKASGRIKKFGAGFKKILGTSMGTSLGAGISGIISMGLSKTKEEVDIISNSIKSEFEKNKKLFMDARRLGVDASKLDKLTKGGNIEGIDPSTIMSMLNSLKEKTRSGEVKGSGDLLADFGKALTYVKNSKNESSSQIFGQDFQGVDLKQLNNTLNQLKSIGTGRISTIQEKSKQSEIFGANASTETSKKIATKKIPIETLNQLLFKEQLKTNELLDRDVPKMVENAVAQQKAMDDISKAISDLVSPFMGAISGIAKGISILVNFVSKLSPSNWFSFGGGDKPNSTKK